MTSEVARPGPDGVVPGREAEVPEPGVPGTVMSQAAEACGQRAPVTPDDTVGAPGAGGEGGTSGGGEVAGEGAAPGGGAGVVGQALPDEGSGATRGDSVGGEGISEGGVAGREPDGSSQAVTGAAASSVDLVQVFETGYLIERPDVSQVVCLDHDVRRINLTALRPVAAAHPYPLVFSSVLGAHLYGFPSTDSDIDLHGVHLLPAAQVVGLRHGPQTVERTWLHDEVTLDLVTHDIGKFLRLMLRRNGFVLEQLLSPLVITTGPVHEELISLAPACLTRRHAHHYRTHAQEQWSLYQQSGQLKPLLYTFRLLLTGIHALRAGAVVTHLPTLLGLMSRAPAYLGELIALKATGEYEDVPVLPERVSDDVMKLQVELDLAENDSPLPDHPGVEGALHDLLVRLRLEGAATYHG